MKWIIPFLYLISLLFSAAMAFIYRKELKGRHLFILLPYLVYVFVQETSLLITGQLGYVKNNNVVYGIYKPINVIVFAIIYYGIPFMAPLRKLIAALTLAYLVVTFIDYCFFESILKGSSYLTLGRGFVVTVLAVLFLFRYFNLDNVAEEKYWRPLIWVTTGIAVFYPVVTTSLAFQSYLAAENATWHGIKLYHIIPQIMSIFMYSCFSYSFYLCRKIK